MNQLPEDDYPELLTRDGIYLLDRTLFLDARVTGSIEAKAVCVTLQ